jgi:hypothetical protein
MTLRQLLKSDIETEVASRAEEWASFSTAVMTQVDAMVEAPRDDLTPVAEALQAESAEVAGAVDWDRFSSSLMARVEAEVAAEAVALEAPSSVHGLLEDEMRDEVLSRDQQWSSFTDGVMSKIAAQERQAKKAPLEERAVQEFKREVAHELEEVEPRFEHDLKDQVQQGVAHPDPGTFTRIGNWWRGLKESRRWVNGLGLAAAATAALALIVLAPESPNRAPPEVVNPIALGEVSVEEVSFEGSVTVMQGGGATVVWLAES